MGSSLAGILSIEKALKRRGIRIGEKPGAQAFLNAVALAPHTRDGRAGRLPMYDLQVAEALTRGELPKHYPQRSPIRTARATADAP